jgi:hypothetical protein
MVTPFQQIDSTVSVIDVIWKGRLVAGTHMRESKSNSVHKVGGDWGVFRGLLLV